MKNYLFVAVYLFIFGCARLPVTERSQAMRKASNLPELSDDLDYENLTNGLRANINFIKNSNRVPTEIIFGPTKINKKKYIAAIDFLITKSPDIQSFKNNVVQNFDFYEVYGTDRWSEIKVTSYYSPLLKGSLKKTRKYSQALYLTPTDMLAIDVDAYAESFPKWKTFKDQILEQKSSKALIRGRLVKDKSGNGRIVPYFKREEIDSEKAINDKSLVIVYVDPIKAFFLQIQGSGVIQLADGQEFTVGYASQNGFPYVAIGSALLDKIPKEKMSMQSIETYLRTLSKKEMQKILNLNPSYVFFQKLEQKPLSYLGAEVVDGRTVATDNSLFPKGTLAFLQFEKPIFESAKSVEPIRWEPTARFVIDQDTGGAIRGPGRLDLYSGSGEAAEQFSGVMKNPAKLFYLVPKPEYIKTFLEENKN